MSNCTELEQGQYMTEERSWAASVLRTAAGEIRRNAIFRALLAELIGKLVARSDTDAALFVLCPGAARAVEEYYAGKYPELRRMLLAPELHALDAWLAADVQRWSARWVALDPARRGSAASTRQALEEVRGEIVARPLPDAIERIASKLRAGGSPPA
jgi:hypothetical protein